MRGAPDYGLYAPKVTTASISDMGEVAARLGSIVTYDKRGDVVDYDNFEDPVLKWNTTALGAGAFVRQDTTNPKSGSQAVNLRSGAAANNVSALGRIRQVLGTQRLGFEASFSKLSTNNYFEIGTSLFDGTSKHQAIARLDPTALKLYVYTGLLEWTEVAEIGELYLTAFAYHTMKAVVDFSTGKYVRLLFTDTEYDISALAPYIVGDPRAAQISWGIVVTTRVAAGGDCWVDDFVFTQAEP